MPRTSEFLLSSVKVPSSYPVYAKFVSCPFSQHPKTESPKISTRRIIPVSRHGLELGWSSKYPGIAIPNWSGLGFPACPWVETPRFGARFPAQKCTRKGGLDVFSWNSKEWQLHLATFGCVMLCVGFPHAFPIINFADKLNGFEHHVESCFSFCCCFDWHREVFSKNRCCHCKTLWEPIIETISVKLTW